MKINNEEITCKYFAYDGCHKIYLLTNKDDKNEVSKFGYKVIPVKKIEEFFKNSCHLRFIYSWDLNTAYVEQGEKAVFEL